MPTPRADGNLTVPGPPRPGDSRTSAGARPGGGCRGRSRARRVIAAGRSALAASWVAAPLSSYMVGAKALSQLIGNRRHTRLRASLVGRLTTDRTGHADPTDGFVTDHDRHATTQRNDVRQLALAG